MTWTFKAIAAAVALASALPAVADGTGYAAVSDHQDTVLATIGKHKITERQVERKLGDHLTTLEAELYEIREHALQAIAADQLIGQAAEKEHLSVEAYVKREVDDKIPEPADADVRDVYNHFKAQLSRSYEQEKPALAKYIKEQRKPQAREALVGRLRTELGMKVFLKAPRLDVAIGDHPVAGPKNAPVTIVEFGDFECPFTQKAEATLKQIRAKYGKKVRLVFIDHPLPVHRHAFGAAMAARCAGDQGKFWEYHDALFADQSKLEPADLKATAAKLKLDTAKFDACLDTGKYDEALRRDGREVERLRVEGTPTFYINGRALFGAESLKDFEELIDQELASGSATVARARE